MPDVIRVNDNTDRDQLIRDLKVCATYPPSPQRTASTDVLLDLLLRTRE